MADSRLTGYVGNPDFHDGSVLAVEQQGATAVVRVRGASGKVFVAKFSGVRAIRANRAEGMVLYALSESVGPLQGRRFNFVNWDDDSLAYLEVDAESVTIHEQ